ncbi:NAD-dependent epimerase/dehydratase family protein [Candidatus Kaiserbacteria bacterium]|nr:NAD-dependent epimerase/dehydratase family protein [Candidatus Kaiserbacteria bacterium]
MWWRKKAKKEGPKILITGGLGFIFSHVTEYYVQKGWDVVVVDNLSEGSHPEIIDGSFTHIRAHMAHLDVVDKIIEEKPDYIVHAAAITDVDYSIREPRRTFEKNMLGSTHAFEAARQLPNLKKIVYVGTDEVYGECDHRMREDEMLLPRSPYACSKAAGSLMRVAYENTYPTLRGKTVEIRPCNIFGPRQAREKILARLKECVQTGEPLPLHNDGKGYREFLYVKNIPSALDLVLEMGDGVYNVGAAEGHTVLELIEKVETLTGKKILTTPEHRSGMDMRYETDSSRIRALGWKPAHSFDEGLREYFLEHV